MKPAAPMAIFRRWQRTWRALAQQLGPRPTPRTASSSEDLALAAEAARCIACGACDRSFDAWSQAPRTTFFGPMHFALAAARGPDGWPRLADASAAAARGNLVVLERVCPVDVPFVALVRAVKARTPTARRPVSSRHHDPG